MQYKEQRVRRCSVIFLLILCVVDDILNDDYINYFIIFYFYCKTGRTDSFQFKDSFINLTKNMKFMQRSERDGQEKSKIIVRTSYLD